jgi:acetyl esterase/lipase
VLRCYTLAALRGISFRHYAQCAFYRFALLRLTPRQLQFMQAPTLTTYNSWLPDRKTRAATKSARNPSDKEAAFLATRLTLDTEALPDGRSSLLWIGDRHKATKFVLFLHGGGYIAPALPGHLEWCLRAYLLASPAAGGRDGEEEEVAVAALQYTLLPDAQYPTQLQQAADAVAHLLASGRVTPGNLVVGGDSAGGNLTAQLLGHLLHPHPAAREVVLAEPLAGAFLVSPWVSKRSEWASARRNGGIDMISGVVKAPVTDEVLKAAEMYGEGVRDEKAWPMPMDLDDAEGWFRGLDKVVKEAYITAGEQEVLRDQGVALADAIRRGNPGTTVKLDVMRDEAHDWILMEGQSAIDGDATQRMRAWFKGVVWP